MFICSHVTLPNTRQFDRLLAKHVNRLGRIGVIVHDELRATGVQTLEAFELLIEEPTVVLDQCVTQEQEVIFRVEVDRLVVDRETIGQRCNAMCKIQTPGPTNQNA